MPYKNKTPVSRLSRKTIIIAVILLFVGASIAIGLSRTNSSKESVTANTGTKQFENEPGSQKLNLDGPTEAEKQQAEDNKDELVKQLERTTPPKNDSKTVTPQVVDAAQYDQSVEVRAFVPNLSETGGTCSATFTQGSATFTRTSSGLADASTTQCARFVIPRSDFSGAGVWNVTVSYTSATANGISSAEAFPVQ